MMERVGLTDITFSTTSFWTAVGTKIINSTERTK